MLSLQSIELKKYIINYAYMSDPLGASVAKI